MEYTTPKSPEQMQQAEMWTAACRCDLDARWAAATKRIETFTQVLGPSAVEPEVRTLVHALQAMGCPTFASCGGHPDGQEHVWPGGEITRSATARPYVALGFLGGQHRGGRMERPVIEYTLSVLRDLGWNLDTYAKNRLRASGTGDNKRTIEPVLFDRMNATPDEIRSFQLMFMQMGDDLKAWFFTHGADECPCLATGNIVWPIWVRQMHAERLASIAA